MTQTKNETQRQIKNKKKILHSAFFRRVLLAVLGVILGINLYMTNARGVLGNQLPMPFGYGIANVLSGSMEPIFSKGALLLVKETDQIEVGDIVVYQADRELIVHRIVEIDGDTVVTQGDANNVADEPFDRAEIKGKVLGWVPGLGAVVTVLKTPLGIILTLVLAFLLIEASFRKQREADDLELEAIKEEIRRLKEDK